MQSTTTMDTLLSAGAKTFAPSAGRNKAVIVDTLKPRLAALRGARSENPPCLLRLVEVASGTGEHASLLAAQVPNLLILPVEPDASMHASIAAWAADVSKGSGSCVLSPISTPMQELTQAALPAAFGGAPVDAMLCINMVHIAPYECTEDLFRLAAELLGSSGMLFTYGPYAQGGAMEPSNEEFHRSLRSRDARWGVRDVTQVAGTAGAFGFELAEQVAMPANNLLLAFCRRREA